MATTPIESLITTLAGFEIIRDKVAQILADESASQMALAAAAMVDPELYRLRVFSERANPWEIALNVQSQEATNTPIVNVWFDVANFDKRMGDVVTRQQPTITINIDVYGYGVSGDDGAGQFCGDEQAARNTQRGVNLAYNMLMAGNYVALDLRGFVGDRWISSISSFQPQLDGRGAPHVAATRLALSVTYSDTTPQHIGDTLGCIHVDIERAEDGAVLAQQHFGSECGN